MSTFTYGSLFTGCGGWDLAADRAGGQCLFQVEIDPIARAVLARHWPDVARHEDVCDVGAHNLPAVDVILFSAPCQDLSVAGKRAGLQGARSGLYFEAIRIIRELRPALAAFEQVPGFLSSNGGRDFGVALDALADIGALDIAWTILDAQYWRIPQRRRRVYAVIDFRAERASEILALADGLSGHPAPRREEKQTTPTGPPGGAGNGGGPIVSPVAATLNSSRPGERGYRNDADTAENLIAYQATGDAFWREGANPLAASDDNGSNHVVAVDIWNHTIDEAVSTTLLAYNGSKAHVLTASDDNGSNHVVAAYGVQTANSNMQGSPVADDVSWAVQPHPTRIAVASAITASAGHHGHSSPRGDGSDNLVIACGCGHVFVAQLDAVCPACGQIRDAQVTILGFSPTNRNPEDGNYEDVSPTLKVGSGPTAIAFRERTRAEGARLEHQADLAYALTNPGDGGRSDERMVAFQQNQRNEVRLLGGDGQQAGALPDQPGMKQQNYVANTMTVRRLTPRECSRLQAYPDDWIPETIADSHHYRLLGNSVCVAVVEWLLRRVVAVMEP